MTVQTRGFVIAILIVATAALGCTLYACYGAITWNGGSGDTLYQIMPYGAMASGIYSGNTTLGELRQHGTFGIGAYIGMEGEMVLLDGQFYQIRTDGVVYRMDDSVKTPYAQVTFFEPDMTFRINETMTYAQIRDYVDNLLPTENMVVAIKITGEFSSATARSVPKQSEPYPPLSEVVVNQTVFNLANISGSALGFRCPSLLGEAVFPGYHLHFLSGDKAAGGHLLDFEFASGTIEVDITPGFEMVCFESPQFNQYVP